MLTLGCIPVHTHNLPTHAVLYLLRRFPHDTIVPTYVCTFHYHCPMYVHVYIVVMEVVSGVMYVCILYSWYASGEVAAMLTSLCRRHPFPAVPSRQYLTPYQPLPCRNMHIYCKTSLDVRIATAYSAIYVKVTFYVQRTKIMPCVSEYKLCM